MWKFCVGWLEGGGVCIAVAEWVVWEMDGGCWVVVVGGGMLGVSTGGLGGGWDDSVWMVSAQSDVKNVVGDEGQEVEQQ